MIQGCNPVRPFIVNGTKIENKGLYEIENLGDRWDRVFLKTVKSNPHWALINDISYIRCPNSQIVVIMKAVCKPIDRGEKKIKKDDFENSALNFIFDLFKARRINKVSPELLSHQKIKINNTEGIEATFETKEPLGCDKSNQEEREVLTKFVVLNRGDIMAFWSWGTNSPKWMIFWYASPVEEFDNGLAEFDKMVQSFRFLGE